MVSCLNLAPSAAWLASSKELPLCQWSEQAANFKIGKMILAQRQTIEKWHGSWRAIARRDDSGQRVGIQQ